MEIKDISIGLINPAEYNPRKDLQPGDPDYDKLVKSLEEFDLVEPLIWNEKTGNLVGGHQRLKILQARGDEVVTVSIVSLTVEKEKALNLALNKIGGGWDIPKLTDLLTELEVKLPDVEVTGFDTKEIQKLTAQFNQSMLPGGGAEPSPDDSVILTFAVADFDAVREDLFELLEKYEIEADIG